jgi:hypothetical protein
VAELLVEFLRQEEALLVVLVVLVEFLRQEEALLVVLAALVEFLRQEEALEALLVVLEESFPSQIRHRRQHPFPDRRQEASVVEPFLIRRQHPFPDRCQEASVVEPFLIRRQLPFLGPQLKALVLGLNQLRLSFDWRRFGRQYLNWYCLECLSQRWSY